MADYETVEGVQRWLRDQGYWLEHVTAASARSKRFAPVLLGQVYSDPETTKLRDIDVVARASPWYRPEALARYAVFECKAGKSGAWIARVTSDVGETAVPIATTRAAQFISDKKLLRYAFPLPSPQPFAILIAGKSEGAYGPLQQAISSAIGVRMAITGSALVHPVVVTTAPLFTLAYEEDEPVLASKLWTRLVVAGPYSGGPTVVDVVTRAGLDDYLGGLWDALDDLSREMVERGWQPDE